MAWPLGNDQRGWHALAERPSGDLALHASVDLASIEIRAGRFAEALTVLTAVTSGDRTTGPFADRAVESAWYMRAVCESRLGSWSTATETLKGFLDRAPTGPLRAQAAVVMGDAWTAQGQFERAAEAFQVAATSADPAVRGAALHKRGAALASAQRWKQSEEAFSAVLAEFPKGDSWPEAQFGVGWARENDGRPTEAIDAYRRVVAASEGSAAARAQFQIGECLFALGRHVEAAGELLKVEILYSYPEWSAAGLYEAGRCFDRAGKSEDATRQFRAVVEKYAGTEWAKLASGQLATRAAASSLPGGDSPSRQHQPAQSK